MKKYVLTGGPSCGKTSLIIHLELIGETTVREVGADIIHYKQSLGIKFPWTDFQNYQDDMLKLQLKREARVDKNSKRVFLDRGVLDTLAYFEFDKQPVGGLIESLIKKGGVKGLYEKVFIIEHSGIIMEESPIRRESLEQAIFLENAVERIYKDYGYETFRIPFSNLEKRIEMILSYL
jgi:predicted ATPase